jgi:hypothetical protein
MDNLVTVCSSCHPKFERIARHAENGTRTQTRPGTQVPYRGPNGEFWSRQWFEY